ncbi:hypothetical protein GV829_01200 [Sphingomonas lacunae]|uniref:Uncharacterized protein n=1 Tax=Sphingomonas lacunae TaxID=2698828 RepID=A0A6M4APT5_9SPHN|nr:hypothetical protein [Sphingomonas lacunae]QJQ31037.1 hypothetical protein GV829_01200 [Sphingomonas lacunae]
MMPPYRFLLAGALVLALSACGRADEDPASGGLTVGESERLEEAAERLDQREPSPARDDSVAFEREIRHRLETENAAISER